MLFRIIMAGNKYNLAFRERILKDYMKGVKQKEIATKYSINKSIVCRIIKRFNKGSLLETEHKGGRQLKHVVSPIEKLFVMLKKILLTALMILLKN